jgi:hypothetical protein
MSELCSLLLTGLLATGIAFAQQPETSQADMVGNSTRSAAHLSKSLEKRFLHMTRRYTLTAEQQAHVKAILLKEEQDAQTVTMDTFMSNANKREEIASLYEASQQKIGAILDKKQKRKFDADEKRRAWMDGRLPEANPGPSLNGSW